MRSQRYSGFISTQDVLRKLSPEDTAVFLQSTSLKSPQLDYLKDFSEFIQANEKLKIQ